MFNFMARLPLRMNLRSIATTVDHGETAHTTDSCRQQVEWLDIVARRII